MNAASLAPLPSRFVRVMFSLMLLLGLPGLSRAYAGQASTGDQKSLNGQTVPAFVYVANQDSDDISAFRVSQSTGAMVPVSGSPFATGAKPGAVVTSPDGKLLFVALHGASAIGVYRIDWRGALEEVSGSPFVTDGEPRELAIDHAGKRLYATREGRDSIAGFAIDAESGALSAVAGSPFHVAHIPAGLVVGAGDKFVYASYATDHSVASFAVNGATGALAASTQRAVPTGISPGKLALTASGKLLYVGNAGSDSVSVFNVDAVSGALTAAVKPVIGNVATPGEMVVPASGTAVYVGHLQAAGLSRINSASQVQTVATQGASALASDASGLFLYAADATGNTVTTYRIDARTRELVAGSAASYATGSGPSSLTIVNRPRAQVTGSISVSLTTGSLLTFSNTSGSVHLSAAAVDGGVSGCAGQVIQLAFSVPSIGVISTATANPADHVCVLTGAQDASFAVTTAKNSGSATLTAFATGFTDGTTSLNVSQRQITVSLPYTNIGAGHTITGTVTLANPAPAGGVTIAIASSATGTATVSPASVTIAAGGASATFTVTGVAANTATLTASVATGGYSNGTLGITIFPPGLTINLPHNASVAPGQSLPYPISIGSAATSAVSVKLVGSGGPGTVTFSPSTVTIPVGATAPTTQPTIKGGAIGPLSVTGSATGFASDTQTATVSITLTFNPNTLSVQAGSTANLTLSASAVAPTGGFVINLASVNTALATVASTITIPAGSSTISVPVKGIAAGNTTVNATAPGAVAASAAITVYAPPSITLYGPNSSSSFGIGKDGVVGVYGTLGVAAPAGNLAVKLTSSSPNLLLTTTQTGAGASSIIVTATAGSTYLPTFYAYAKANTGSATITATATGYANGLSPVTFVPSGFIVQGGTTTTTSSAPAAVNVTFAQLDPVSLAYTAGLTIRPGISALAVVLKSSNTAVGTLNPATVSFKSGNSQLQTTLKPVAAGTTNVTFNATPAGYSTPSNYQSTTYTLTAAATILTLCNGAYISGTGSVSLGYNSVCSATAQLATAAPAGGRIITLTSSSTASMLLSTSATAVGTGAITVTVPAGSTYAPAFYIQSRLSTGSATLTETASGYSTTTLTTNFTPSGFIVQGGTTTTTTSNASPVYVTFAQLDPTTLNYTGALTLRPGIAVTVPLKNSNTTVGTLASSSIAFTAGKSQLQTTYQPKTGGTSIISFNATPTGYAAPANYNTTTFTVSAAATYTSFCNGQYISGTGTVTFGYNSVCSAYAQLATAAPAGGKTVTLTSSAPSKLLLSTSATTVGTASITLNIPAGSSYAPTFYTQMLASSGSATMTESVPGYATTTVTFNFAPSGFIVQGGTNTTTFSGTSPVYVTFAQLDPTTLNYAGGLTLRPGVPTTNVVLKNSNAAVGTLGGTTLAFNPGDTSKQTTFQPTGTAAGTAIISFNSTLAGYATPANYNTTTFTVTAPNTYISFCNGQYIQGTGAIALGYNSSCSSYAQLATAAPSGGRSITLTVSDPSKMRLSTSATVTGGTSISLPVAAGSSYSAPFYIQSLVPTGSATITESASGYNPTTATVNFTPSGFIVQGGTNTTTFSNPSPVYVTFAQLDPATLNYTGGQTLRAGVTANLALKNSNTAVGTLTASTLSFGAGDTSKQTTFQPSTAGSAIISFNGTPAGYSAASNYNTTTYTVTAPNTYISFCNGQYIQTTGAIALGYNSSCSAYPQLAVAAPAGGRTITLTSSSTAKLLLSTSPTAVGSGSVTVSVAAGGSYASPVYIQSLASTGSATITETASGYNPTVATVNFTPSGFIVQGGTNTTTVSTPSPVYVTFAQLDPTTLNYIGGQTMRAGVTANVPLKNSSTATGTLASSTITFTAGSTGLQTTYQPVAAGTSIISFNSTLAGYGTPGNYNTTTYTVTAPTINIYPITIGKYMQKSTYGYLAQPAPSGGRTVTITSPSPSTMVLSLSNTVTGSASISFTIAEGQTYIPSFYVQSLGGATGIVNLISSATSYANTPSPITVNPSGFALQGSNFTTHLSDNPTTLTVVPAVLDSQFLNVLEVQQLVPNLPNTKATLTLTDQSGTSPVGQITLNPVVFQGADNPNSLTTSFQPLHAGSTLIKITSPAGFTNASSEVTATVVSP